MREQKKLFLIQETAFLTRWSHLGSNQGPLIISRFPISEALF